jgi:hypothetical protein
MEEESAKIGINFIYNSSLLPKKRKREENETFDKETFNQV